MASRVKHRGYCQSFQDIRVFADRYISATEVPEGGSLNKDYLLQVGWEAVAGAMNLWARPGRSDIVALHDVERGLWTIVEEKLVTNLDDVDAMRMQLGFGIPNARTILYPSRLLLPLSRQDHSTPLATEIQSRRSSHGGFELQFSLAAAGAIVHATAAVVHPLIPAGLADVWLTVRRAISKVSILTRATSDALHGLLAFADKQPGSDFSPSVGAGVEVARVVVLPEQDDVVFDVHVPASTLPRFIATDSRPWAIPAQSDDDVSRITNALDRGKPNKWPHLTLKKSWNGYVDARPGRFDVGTVVNPAPRFVWTLHKNQMDLQGPPIAVRRRVLEGGEEYVGFMVEVARRRVPVSFDDLRRKGMAHTYASLNWDEPGCEVYVWVYDHCPAQNERQEWIKRRELETAAMKSPPRMVWVYVPAPRLGAPDGAIRCRAERRLDSGRRGMRGDGSRTELTILLPEGERGCVDLFELCRERRATSWTGSRHKVVLDEPSPQELAAAGAARAAKAAEEARWWVP